MIGYGLEEWTLFPIKGKVFLFANKFRQNMPYLKWMWEPVSNGELWPEHRAENLMLRVKNTRISYLHSLSTPLLYGTNAEGQHYLSLSVS